MSAAAFAGDADTLSTACMSDGMSDTVSKTDLGVRVVVLTNGKTSLLSIRTVTLDTQRRWKTRWRQRLSEFDTCYSATESSLPGQRN